jgi:hypothetical protein
MLTLKIHSYHKAMFPLKFGEMGVYTQGSHSHSRWSTTLSTPPDHFVLVSLEMGASQTIHPDWPQTVILPISASQVARITGVSTGTQAPLNFK